MAKIKKTKVDGALVYPATIFPAVKDPNTGQTLTDKLSELGQKQQNYTLKGVDGEYTEVRYHYGVDGHIYRIYFHNTTWDLQPDSDTKLSIHAEKLYIKYLNDDEIPNYLDVPYKYNEGVVHVLAIAFRGANGSELKFSIQDITAIEELKSDVNKSISNTEQKIKEETQRSKSEEKRLDSRIDNLVADDNEIEETFKIADSNGRVLAEISKDGIKTENFNSKDIFTIDNHCLIFKS